MHPHPLFAYLLAWVCVWCLWIRSKEQYSSLEQITSLKALGDCMLSLSAVCIKTVSSEQKPELALQFFWTRRSEIVTYTIVQSCCGFLWIVLALEMGQLYPPTQPRFATPSDIWIIPHAVNFVHASLALFRPSYKTWSTTVRVMNNCSDVSHPSPTLCPQIMLHVFVIPPDNWCGALALAI